MAVSRVIRLDGIIFERSFILKDFRVEKDRAGRRRIQDYYRYLYAGEILKPVTTVPADLEDFFRSDNNIYSS